MRKIEVLKVNQFGVETVDREKGGHKENSTKLDFKFM